MLELGKCSWLLVPSSSGICGVVVSFWLFVAGLWSRGGGGTNLWSFGGMGFGLFGLWSCDGTSLWLFGGTSLWSCGGGTSIWLFGLWSCGGMSLGSFGGTILWFDVDTNLGSFGTSG